VKVGIIGKLWKRSAVGWFIESCSKCRSFKLIYVVSKNFLPATARIRSKAAISYRNSLLSQKSRCYVNEGRALNDLILSHCTESVRILTATTMNVCHLWPPHKCHVICKFSANGTTRVEVRNLEISFLRKVVREHVGIHYPYRRDQLALRTTASKTSSVRLPKQGQVVLLYFYYSENVNCAAYGPRVGGHSWSKHFLHLY